MMQHMRERAPVYFLITLGSFILFGFLVWGRGTVGLSSSPDVAGKVNGETISMTEYRRAADNAFASYRNRGGRELGDAERTALEDQAWQQLVRDHLFAQLVRKYGITISDDEVVEAVRTSPPQEIAQLPQFQTNGQFDQAKYRAALSNPNIDWTPVEVQVRQMLPIQKLQERIVAGVVVSESEVRQRFQAENEAAAATYALVPLSRFPVDSASVTEDAIRAYYASHQRAFRAPEMAKVFLTQIPKQATPADTRQAREVARGVLDEIHAGRDFSEMAKSTSEGAWASSGGISPQPVPVANISPTVRAALDALEPGQVSDLVTDQAGVHILLLDSRTTTADGKPAVKYGDILIRVQPGSETIAATREKADALAERAKKVGLQQAAAEMKLQGGETPYWSRDQAVLGADFPALTDFAFSAKIGATSPPLERPQGYFVVKLLDRRDAGVRPLAEARAEIRARLVRARQVAQAKALAERVRAQVLAGTPLETAAASAGLTVATAPGLKRSGDVPNIGPAPALLGAAFGTPIGRVSSPVEIEQGVVLVRPASRTPADMAQYPAQRDQLRQRITQERQQDALNRWFTQIMQSAKIRDLRARALETGQQG